MTAALRRHSPHAGGCRPTGTTHPAFWQALRVPDKYLRQTAMQTNLLAALFLIFRLLTVVIGSAAAQKP